jgi:LacI family transcriptional regulator
MATLKDVARVARVSATTVSRVLSGDPNLTIPPDTRERIIKASEAVQYRARARAREIGKRNLRTVGIVAFRSEQYELGDPYFLSIRRGVEQQCVELGFTSSISYQWSDIVRTQADLSELDGLVVIGENDQAVEYLREGRQRVVFVDRSPDPSRFDSVVIDFERSSRMAIDHLCGLGYETIGFIGVINPSEPVDVRATFFESYMRDRGRFAAMHVHIGEQWSTNAGYELGRACLARGNLARAYFVASDPLAIGAMRAFAEAGVRVPEDVAIVSFDDIEVAAYMTPPLTTVHVPTEAMGRIAVDLLVDGIGTHDVPLKITVPTELKVRESCGRTLPSALRGTEEGGRSDCPVGVR